MLLSFLVVAFAIYFPSLHNELVWDDHYLVSENPFFRSPIFALEVFRHYLFSESFSTYYRPVQNLSYMLDYWVWGDWWIGYRCTNIALHACAAWLLYLLLRRLLPGFLKTGRQATTTSLLVAFAWLVHPIHNAAVAYISGRADTLAAIFALGAWLLWEISTNSKRKLTRVATSILSPTLLLLALCSKEIALVWIALFLTYTWWFRKGNFTRSRVAETAGVIAVVAIFAILHALPGPRAVAPGDVADPLGVRIVLMLRALGDYTGLMFAPIQLMMERSLGPTPALGDGRSWWQVITNERLAILGLAALAVATWLCARRAEGRSLRRFGALWFAVAFLPISNLIPLNAKVAEHWIYLASIGFLLFVAGVIVMLPPRAVRWASACACVLICGLAVRTSFRAADWADGERFARATISSGSLSPRILLYLAQELGRKGRVAEQEQIYRKTLTLYPNFTTARVNLGLCLQKQGRIDEATALLDLGRPSTAAQGLPRTWNAALNLAGQYHKQGRSGEALALVRDWRPQFPETWELAAFEATILRDTGKTTEAVAVVEAYAEAHWWHLPSQLGAAAFRREAGDYAKALALARHAQWLDIRGAAAYDEASRNEFALGRFDEALESQAVAISRAPHRGEYLEFFSAILHALGREHEALIARRKAASLAANSRAVL